jgi:hypothetical protein
MCGACACWAVCTGLQISGPDAVRSCAIASPDGALIKLEKSNETESQRRSGAANGWSARIAAASRIRNNRCDLKFAAADARTRNQHARRSITIPSWHMEKGDWRSRDFSGAPKWKRFRRGGPFWNFRRGGGSPPARFGSGCSVPLRIRAANTQGHSGRSRSLTVAPDLISLENSSKELRIHRGGAAASRW